MEAHIGEVFEGVISGITNWGIYVEPVSYTHLDVYKRQTVM